MNCVLEQFNIKNTEVEYEKFSAFFINTEADMKTSELNIS